MNHQLGNSGDLWSENDIAHCHRFHKDNGNALAAAGENDQVSHGIVGVELFVWNLPEQPYFFGERELANEAFEEAAFSTLPSDKTQGAEACAAQFCARFYKEEMILHG